MRIETERLYIVEFRPEMAETFYRNSLDEDNRRFTPEGVYPSVAEAMKEIAIFLDAYQKDIPPFVYAVLRKDGRNIGNIQLVWFHGQWEIGYHIAKEFAGRGYAAEAVRAFLPAIREKTYADYIYGVCLADNIASRRVLEKTGFQKLFEGEGHYGGQIRQICRYIYEGVK